MSIWYVSPTGSSSNSGLQSSPWAFTTLATTTAPKPGDTIRLIAGKYGTGVEQFTIGQNGVAGQPIVIMPNPGDQVEIDCRAILFQGAFTWLYNDTLCNLEIRCSTVDLTGDPGTDLVRMQEFGNGNKIINAVVHDAAGVGISPQSETADLEVNGNFVYNCGRAPVFIGTGAAGHGIYPHGTTTAGQTRKIRGNVVFNSVDYGIHCFADTGNLQNLDVENNIAVDNGLNIPGEGVIGFDYLIGGQTALQNLVFVKNVALRTNKQTTISLGYLSESDPGAKAISGIATDNYAHGQITINHWDGGSLSFQRNTVVSTSGEVVKYNFQDASPVTTGILADNNTYCTLDPDGFGPFGLVTNLGASATDFPDIASWRAATGFDLHSTFAAQDNIGTVVKIFASDYVTGRGTMAIDNPSGGSTVSVVLGSIVPIGASYAIYSMFDLPMHSNLGATPVLSGTYVGGSVAVPMTGKTPQAVPGGVYTPNNGLPFLHAFLIVVTAAAGTTPPPVITPPAPAPNPILTPVLSLPMTGPFKLVYTAADEDNNLDNRLADFVPPAPPPTAAVASISVSPSSLQLTIGTTPTQVAVASISVSPSSLTLTAPGQQVVNGMTWAAFGHTYFGQFPSTTDLQWAEGPPLFRFGWTMSGNGSLILAQNPGAYTNPYALHHVCEATGQETTEGITSSWGTAAVQWAQGNGRNVENIFLHAAVGQVTNKSTVVSLSATGLVSLGINSANGRQQLSCKRVGDPTSYAFPIGAQFTVQFTNPAFNQVVTVTGIPSTTTIQTDYSGTAQTGTGGQIYRLGDGTLTLANRTLFEGDTDWCWAANPGSQDSKDFQVFRVGQILGTVSTGIFWDAHSSSEMHAASAEYGTTSSVQYVNDICALFTLYRATYPGTIYFPNISNHVQPQDAQMADAAGGVQQEGGISLFSSTIFGSSSSPGVFAVARLGAGDIVEISSAPGFNSATPHAGATGLTSAFVNGGTSFYTTNADRAMMCVYAAYLTIINATGSVRLYLDPANQFWDTFPLSARWEQAWEFNLGRPVDALTPPLFVYFTGTDGSSQKITVYARAFTQDGTTNTPFSAIVLFRRNETSATDYTIINGGDSVPLPISQFPPPAGKQWVGLVDDGSTFVPPASIALPMMSCIILIPA